MPLKIHLKVEVKQMKAFTVLNSIHEATNTKNP